MTNAFGLGCRPQVPDVRDHSFKTSVAPGALPEAHNLVTLHPERFGPIENQGRLGACTSFGTGRARRYAYTKAGFHNAFVEAHLFTYFGSRLLEGNTESDAGASIADAVKAANRWGVCADHWFPYNDANPGPFTDIPDPDAYKNAATHLTVAYAAVPPSAQGIKAAIASDYPVAFGISVYESFFTAPSGNIPLPQQGEKLAGGHCILAVGYNDASQTILCANSWGPTWGNAGYALLPYAYFTPQLAFDAWVLTVQK